MTFNPDNPKEHEEYLQRKKSFDVLPTEEKIKKIADKLNTNKSVDFSKYQARYYLSYDFNSKMIMQLVNGSLIKEQGVIYCLNQDFKKECIKYINEEELINYLKK